MPLEIERKFLVTSTQFINDSFLQEKFKQGYLNSDKDRTVRVRIAHNKAYLTIKGITNKTGTSRYEWEKEISLKEAEELLLLSEKPPVEKTRYFIKVNKHIFEVDIFEGENKGLILAEVELNDENEKFEIPKWLGKEVTGDIKYYNANLSINPYQKWN